jgi:hypothetical protein
MSRAAEAAWIVVPVAGLLAAVGTTADPITTATDFFTPGTQPLEFLETFETAQVCAFCHGGYQAEHEPFRPWVGSMMGQATRDPVFHAAVAIANQDAPGSGVSCFRCHSPMGELEGRVTPDGSELIDFDFEGISCIICHRMVDPEYKPGISPAVDLPILQGLDHPPVSAHNAAWILDPEDRRRGPFTLTQQATYHPWLQSPFHQTSNLCATCHEVSNPAFTKQPDGTYALNAFNTPHPTQNKLDMFPEQRTYSEWSKSAFAQAPIDMGGRFGGNKLLVSTCQDCHMPDATDTACEPFLGGAVREDLPQHHFAGANTWVLRAVNKLYDQSETNLDDETVEASIARNLAMLSSAADINLSVDAGQLNVRIVNQTGHKLPTGYPEGRRMWVNVVFEGASGALAERGAYNFDTATLTEGDTKVYEGKIGMDAATAAISGRPAGPGFHLALNNTWFSDNRIPPRGFNNAEFASVQAAPVAYTYADGQYWDDTEFAIPPGTRRVVVNLYYQTSSREYMEFLRDANTTNNRGLIVWNEYMRFGKSAPHLMVQSTMNICIADFNFDGFIDFFDYDDFVAAFEAGTPTADVNGDQFIDFFDYDDFVGAFEAGCG